MSPPRVMTVAIWTVAIAAVVGFVYARVVPTFFIADDLCDLLFLRDVRQAFWEHLDPMLHYTDATTRSRFVPLSLCCTWVEARRSEMGCYVNRKGRSDFDLPTIRGHRRVNGCPRGYATGSDIIRGRRSS